MLYLNLTRMAGGSLIKQIYLQIRQMIMSGELPECEKLPSTRELAQNLNVSRTTVITAYEMLTAEGLVSSVPGSGIFVSPGAKFTIKPNAIQDYCLTAFSPTKLVDDTINFHSGTPALDLFPRNKWLKLTSQALKDAPVSALGYDFPGGRPEFRATLAAYLKRARGIHCHPDQIIVTSGAKQGLTLIAKCLLGPQKEVLLEDPTNANVRKIFSYHTQRLTPIPVDAKGIRPELFPKDRSPALIFVSPSHQFPLGGILPVQRRLALIHYAEKHNCYITEDDYDSEFRYKGLPTNSLQELAGDKVIYVGTFSKTVFPSVRLGYVVLPQQLVGKCTELKRLLDHHSNSLSQLAMMRFIDSGDLERHISRMTKIYAKRRNQLIAALSAVFQDEVSVLGADAGLHVVAEFAGVSFSPELMLRLEQAGVGVIPVEEHALIKGRHASRIILGYGHLTPEAMETGLQRIKQVLAEEKRNAKPGLPAAYAV